MKFETELKYFQKKIDKELKSFFDSLKFLGGKNSLLRQEIKILKDFCLSPGKRLRPLLAVAAFQAISGKKTKNKIIFPAISLELYHNHTLIHDDIYDEDIVRRGKPAAHVLFEKWFKKKYSGDFSRFGQTAAFISGKTLRALSILPILKSDIPQDKKLEILNIFHHTDISDNTGQALDLYFEKEDKISEKDYLKMVDCKTGGLFKASVEIGAVLAKADKKQRRCLRNYAENLAAAFQIKDDLLDISVGGEKGRGKGSDIKQGKKTLLLVYTLKKAGAKEKKIIKNTIGKGKVNQTDINRIVNLYRKLGAAAHCQKTANQKIKKALYWLNRKELKLKPGSGQLLEQLANFMLQRKK